MHTEAKLITLHCMMNMPSEESPDSSLPKGQTGGLCVRVPNMLMTLLEPLAEYHPDSHLVLARPRLITYMPICLFPKRSLLPSRTQQ